MLLFAIPLFAAVAGCSAGQGGYVAPSILDDPAALGDLQRAKELYKDGRYRDAERLFKKLANTRRYPRNIADEAVFFHGECLFNREEYSDAHKAYRRLLTEMRRSNYFEAAVQREFQIGTGCITGETPGGGSRKFGAGVLEAVLRDSPYGPYSAQARLLLAEYYYDIGRYFDAVRHCDLLITHYAGEREVEPARYLKAMAGYHTLTGNRRDGTQIDSVIESLEEARSLVLAQPDSVRRTQRLTEVEAKIAELREKRVAETYNLAQYFLKNGNRQAALLSLQQVLEYAPDSYYGKLARVEIESLR